MSEPTEHPDGEDDQWHVINIRINREWLSGFIVGTGTGTVLGAVVMLFARLT